MSDLIPIQAYANPVEAELAKNALEAQGIPAMITANGDARGVGVDLVVTPENVERAKEILEGGQAATAEVSSEDLQLAEQQKKEQDEAAKEFEEMKNSELEIKARGINSARNTGILFLIGAGIAPFIFQKGGLGIRLAAVCVLFSIIQFFVWKDAVAAKKKIEEGEKN